MPLKGGEKSLAMALGCDEIGMTNLPATLDDFPARHNVRGRSAVDGNTTVGGVEWKAVTRSVRSCLATTLESNNLEVTGNTADTNSRLRPTTPSEPHH